VAQGIGESDTMQILTVVPFLKIWEPVALVFLGVGILVGVGGSLTAIRRFLRV
jgi:cell division transport system permease protein